MNRNKLKGYRFLMIIVSFLLIGLLACNMRPQNKMNSKEKSNNELITVEFGNQIESFKINGEYPLRLNTQIDKRSILVSSNNGLIKRSNNERFDFVFYPKKHGKLTLRFYEDKNGMKTEIYTTNLMIE